MFDCCCYCCCGYVTEPNWGPKRRAGRAEKVEKVTATSTAASVDEEGDDEPSSKKPKA